MDQKYLCHTKDHPDVARDMQELEDACKNADDRAEFLVRQLKAIEKEVNEKRLELFDRAAARLKHLLPSDYSKDKYALTYAREEKILYISPKDSGSIADIIRGLMK